MRYRLQQLVVRLLLLGVGFSLLSLTGCIAYQAHPAYVGSENPPYWYESVPPVVYGPGVVLVTPPTRIPLGHPWEGERRWR